MERSDHASKQNGTARGEVIFLSRSVQSKMRVQKQGTAANNASYFAAKPVLQIDLVLEAHRIRRLRSSRRFSELSRMIGSVFGNAPYSR
jgi:hypothetical protein